MTEERIALIESVGCGYCQELLTVVRRQAKSLATQGAEINCFIRERNDAELKVAAYKGAIAEIDVETSALLSLLRETWEHLMPDRISHPSKERDLKARINAALGRGEG